MQNVVSPRQNLQQPSPNQLSAPNFMPASLSQLTLIPSSKFTPLLASTSSSPLSRIHQQSEVGRENFEESEGEEDGEEGPKLSRHKRKHQNTDSIISEDETEHSNTQEEEEPKLSRHKRNHQNTGSIISEDETEEIPNTQDQEFIANSDHGSISFSDSAEEEENELDELLTLDHYMKDSLFEIVSSLLLDKANVLNIVGVIPKVSAEYFLGKTNRIIIYEYRKELLLYSKQLSTTSRLEIEECDFEFNVPGSDKLSQIKFIYFTNTGKTIISLALWIYHLIKAGSSCRILTASNHLFPQKKGDFAFNSKLQSGEKVRMYRYVLDDR